MKKLGLLDAWESLTALTLHNRPFNYTEEQSVFTVETMQKVNCNCKWVLMPPVVLAANVIMLHQSVAHVVCVARCLPTHVSPAKKKLKKGKLTCTVRTSQTATCFNWCCNLPPLLYKLPCKWKYTWYMIFYTMRIHVISIAHRFNRVASIVWWDDGKKVFRKGPPRI